MFSVRLLLQGRVTFFANVDRVKLYISTEFPIPLEGLTTTWLTWVEIYKVLHGQSLQKRNPSLCRYILISVNLASLIPTTCSCLPL